MPKFCRCVLRLLVVFTGVNIFFDSKFDGKSDGKYDGKLDGKYQSNTW